MKASIPISGSWPVGEDIPDERIARAVIDQLSKGVTYWDQRPPRARVLGRAVGEVLGRSSAGCWFLSCSDSRILRIGMAAAIIGPDRDLDELAEELGEPREVVEQIRSVWSSHGGRTWLTTNTRSAITKMYVLAALHPEGVVGPDAVEDARISEGSVAVLLRHDDRWRRDGDDLCVEACRHCGAHKFAVVRFRELAGVLCLDCRHDEAGLLWPVDYDRYIDCVESYIAAGLVEPCVPATSQSPCKALSRAAAEWLKELDCSFI